MPNRLYVGNLPYSVKETDLANFFASAGKVEKTSIVIDRDTGKPRGFGFVDMATDEEAKKAIETLNGADMQGRPLVVNEARPKEDRPRSQGARPPYRKGTHGGGNGHSGSHRDFEESRPDRRAGKGDWRENRRQSNRQGYEDSY